MISTVVSCALTLTGAGMALALFLSVSKKGGDVLRPGTRLNVFAIRRFGENNEGVSWRLAGMAWINRDGSINLKLDVLPIGGELHLREPVPETKATTNRATTQRVDVSSNQTNTPSLEAADATASLGGH